MLKDMSDVKAYCCKPKCEEVRARVRPFCTKYIVLCRATLGASSGLRLARGYNEITKVLKTFVMVLQHTCGSDRATIL